jgi:hypothetical protein
MTKQAGFKRRVRARMAKTGESYAAARGRLLTEHPGATPDDSPLDWMPEALHITNGDATDVPGTGLARRVVYWRDVLHEGPVPEVPPAELRRIRVDFLTGYQGVERGETMRLFTERDQALEAGRDGEYVLWFEADLYDQLQIAEILARLADLSVPAERITLICIGDHAGIAPPCRPPLGFPASGNPSAVRFPQAAEGCGCGAPWCRRGCRRWWSRPG